MAADEAICRSFLEKDLTCRMCLDIFVDATLLPICGHTFCRSCLKRSNESYDQQVVYIRCSVCEKINNLTSEKGFDDLPANETVNKIVDNYIQDRVCKTAPRQKCTACRRPEDAVSFCRTCHKYLCEGCQTSHREMFDYEGHETVPFDFEKMLVKEKVSIDYSS
ncbi:E3 ubiquitin-protein ligase Midline-1-like [Lytechinus variegatus]|uniref:E3 ubiquitin-protein ligase Midline-1-like n=1 Tax=Lytechinus variegatus TaxID=7654 RepID=UPI001BB1A359|nr:E3 ubiquitin-protein ligase Midline-1-like [Lytechinus variegatus]